MKRPRPETVRVILDSLFETQENVYPADLVAAIRRESGCSRASAYRAAKDAVEAGVISYKEDGSETETT